jgi:hypothetical protein
MRNVSQGAVLRIRGTFRNAAGALTDPTVVTFYIKSEDGDIEDTYVYGVGANVIKSSTGIFYLLQDTSDQSGVYNWRIVGTGAAVGALQGEFYVVPMAPDDESSSCEDDSV